MVGYLKFTDNFALRTQGQKRRAVYQEYNKGDLYPVYDVDDWRANLFLDEDIVQVLTPDMKVTTWDKLTAKQPKQQPLTVNQVKPTRVKQVRKKK